MRPNMEVEMFIKWPEVSVALGIITKECMEESCILIGNPMYGHVDAVLLWMILLAKYLVNKCNLKRSKSNSCIFLRKYDKGNLELVMSVHVDDVFMADKTKTLKNIKEKMN